MERKTWIDTENGIMEQTKERSDENQITKRQTSDGKKNKDERTGERENWAERKTRNRHRLKK